MKSLKENKFKQKLTKLANELFDVVSEYDNVPEVEKFLNSMYTTETAPQEKRYLMETKKMLPKVKSSILKDSQLTIKKLEQKFKECPPATHDVDLNTKNRDSTVKNHNYGPLNTDEPGDYWEKVADKWNTSVEAVRTSLCGNCTAFDVSPRMLECMPGEVSDESGVLGYCWMHHFKCHSARSCNTWAKGGPIKDDKISYIWGKKAFGEKK